MSHVVLKAILIMMTAFQLQTPGASLTLVSDLPTPSFIVDMDMLRKATSSNYVPLYLPNYKRTIFPYSLDSDQILANSDLSTVGDAYNVQKYDGQISALGYFHASVTRSRDEKEVGNFLAQLDLGTNLGAQAQLVMGINNHHVGSYYWARSAGMGASMEAPGISFGASENDNVSGVLSWQGKGPLDCNSNDGKRSEWVNFLRVGDLVQLLPTSFEDGIMSFVESFQGNSNDNCRVYGFSSQGRPLGSEPVVVCQWRTNYYL